MYLIIGLGNPEEEYSKTRHNMGFNAINKIAEQYGIKVNKSKFQGLYESAIIEGQKVMLIKPQTYMNLSGECIKQFVDFYKIPKEEIPKLDEGVEKAKEAVIEILKNGIDSAMNKLN